MPDRARTEAGAFTCSYGRTPRPSYDDHARALGRRPRVDANGVSHGDGHPAGPLDRRPGIEAVEATRRLKPDVVLMDVRMPEMDACRRRGCSSNPRATPASSP